MENRAARAKAARRAADVRIKAQQMELARTTDERAKARIETTIGKLQSLAEQTRLYSGGKRIAGRTTAFREAAIDALEDLNQSVGTRAKNRKFETNAQFAEEMREASRGSKIDTMTEIRSRAFMRATQESWEGKDIQTRYAAMQKYYGAEYTRDIYDAFMYYFEKDVAQLEAIMKKVEKDEPLSAEEKDFMLNLKREEDEHEKVYRKDDPNAPKPGMIASKISSGALTRDMFNKYIELRNAGKLEKK